MSLPNEAPRSVAKNLSWTSLLLAVGGVLCLLTFQAVNQITPYEVTRQGVLIGLIPLVVLCILLGVELLAVGAAAGSVLLIRPTEMTSKSMFGIVVRSLTGTVVGLCAAVVLWLWVGHFVIGF